MITDDLDAEAAYLMNLIPPKDESKEKKGSNDNTVDSPTKDESKEKEITDENTIDSPIKDESKEKEITEENSTDSPIQDLEKSVEDLEVNIDSEDGDSDVQEESKTKSK